MVENYDLHTLFGMIDEEEFVSECINLVVDESIDKYEIRNFQCEIYLQKERHELLFENYVDNYHGYGGSNGKWVNMDEFFDQARLGVELCAKYKHVLLPLVKEMIFKLELHVSYTITKTTKTI